MGSVRHERRQRQHTARIAQAHIQGALQRQETAALAQRYPYRVRVSAGEVLSTWFRTYADAQKTVEASDQLRGEVFDHVGLYATYTALDGWQCHA